MSGATVPWIPVAVGIGVMVGFLIYGVMLRGDDRPPLEVPAGAGHQVPSAEPAPTPSAEPTVPPELTPPPTEPPATEPPATEPPATEPPDDHPPPPPPPPDVVGKYHLKHTFEKSFIASVVVANKSDHPRVWKLTLAYPADVGDLIDFWVDGTKQPAVHQSGHTFTFTSAAPVDVDSSVVLTVKFARSGDDIDPAVCEVNHTHCRR